MRHTRSILAHAALWSALAFSGAAAGAVQEQLDYTYYDASTQPGQPLYAALLAASPIRENGKSYMGYTRWNIRWNFRWQQQASGECSITSTSTTLSARITLPRLQRANAQQHAVFERFVSALREHEMGHYAIGQQAAQAVEASLRAQPSQRDCATLEASANANAQQALARFNGKDQQYDQDTKHGKTQGAWLSE